MVDIVSKLIAELSDALGPEDAERCGLVTADGELLEIKNIHSDPWRGFHMEPKALIEGVGAGAVATWHTHPAGDPNLSHEDLNGFRQWPQLVHFILGVRDGEPTVQSFQVVDDVVVML